LRQMDYNQDELVLAIKRAIRIATLIQITPARSLST
jgi:hypothetical protein